MFVFTQLGEKLRDNKHYLLSVCDAEKNAVGVFIFETSVLLRKVNGAQAVEIQVEKVFNLNLVWS